MAGESWRHPPRWVQGDDWRRHNPVQARQDSQWRDPYTEWYAGPSASSHPQHYIYDYRQGYGQGYGHDAPQHYRQDMPDWRHGNAQTENAAYRAPQGYGDAPDWRVAGLPRQDAYSQQSHWPQQEYNGANYYGAAPSHGHDRDLRAPTYYASQHRRYEPAPRWTAVRASERASYSTDASSAQSDRGKHNADRSSADAQAPRRHHRDRRMESEEPNGRSTTTTRTSRTGDNGSMPSRRTPHRTDEQHAIGQIMKPRAHYLRQSAAAPEDYLTETEPPKPLMLLVLDLNGTLVFRPGGRTTPAAHRSASAVHRPYLKCFLQYCLALDCPVSNDKERTSLWKGWDEVKDQRNDSKMDGTTTTRHGTHFWQDAQHEPEPPEQATFRLLLWSSARPENVDLMARTIFAPAQAEQLLRVYARDTLLVRRLYGRKSPSIKDLEILWAALNDEDKIKARGRNGTSPLKDEDGNASREHPADAAEARTRGERRLFADVREQEGQACNGERDQFEEELHALWHKHIVMPQLQGDEIGTYSDGNGYGPHNTLLLDDSTDKAALQPYNHILVPEFDEARAQVAMAACKTDKLSDDRQSNQEQERDEAALQPEDILLQVIGVLEHARYQRNMSAWIRMGGLGDFGGMAKQHPYYKDEELTGVESAKAADKIVTEAAAYFSESIEEDKDEDSVLRPNLRAKVENRTQSFWAKEGERALQRRGITTRMFD